MKTNILPFRPEHLDNFTVREPEASIISLPSMKQLAEKHPSYTLVIGNNIVCCFGVVVLWAGTGEFWMIPGEQIANHKIAFFKVMKDIHNKFIEGFELNRLQCTCLVENENSRRWIERNGFQVEGILRKYRNGKDFYRLSKVVI